MMITLRICDEQDVHALREVSIETFNDTFGKQNKPENMQAYLAKAVTETQLRRELATVNSTFFFLYADGELAGFMKVNTEEAQSEPMDGDSFEIERIYIRQAFQKQGLGSVLIHKAFELAAAQKKRKIWLGVWEKNDNAVAFYEQKGFVRTGAHSFHMGDEEQTDWILTKMLE